MSAPRLSAETKSSILRDYLAGDDLPEIAAKYGVDRSYPTLLAKRRGYLSRKSVGMGFRLPANSLTVADTDDILNMARQGLSAPEIVEKFAIDGDVLTIAQVIAICAHGRVPLGKKAPA